MLHKRTFCLEDNANINLLAHTTVLNSFGQTEGEKGSRFYPDNVGESSSRFFFFFKKKKV